MSGKAAADDIGIHQMSRISELLSPAECEAFHRKITHPEENVMKLIDKMSEENDNLFKVRQRRAIVSVDECRNVLIDWLKKEGDTMYWDRLSRALSQIGRSDVDREMGKNLNQDKTLEVKKYIEEYNKGSPKTHSSLVLTDEEIKINGNRGKRSNFLENWDELELIIEMKKHPPYPRNLTEGFRTVLWGVLLGFVGSTVLGGISLYFIVKIAERDCVEMMRRSSMLCRVKRRRKPTRQIVYSSDDETTYKG
ncbi:transmembrane and death domain protein 1-like [Callorhinchus milii]|uniref:transmembrane and death domain protein 1-like n=1 Tax=Callorhinchus milii TaxID=7868 RepID=UPI0004571B42|nr:transmembrane and death domain protein 1-like [Callorhinchus milii]|eukprot:gi/632953592/ref/XP_007892502.1/ PREDICTED: uncharacterized protein LOC103179180 [Callorhinchus milii]